MDCLMVTFGNKTNEWFRWYDPVNYDLEEEEEVWVEILNWKASQVVKRGQIDLKG